MSPLFSPIMKICPNAALIAAGAALVVYGIYKTHALITKRWGMKASARLPLAAE